MMSPIFRRLAASVYLVLAPTVVPLAADAAGPTDPVRIYARTFTPGEPLRVEVRPSDAIDGLETLEGRFLDESFPLYTDGNGRWTGWTMIPLGTPPREQVVRFEGATISGPWTHAVTLRIEDKSFPSESLEVESRYVEPPEAIRERIAAEREELRVIYLRRTAGSNEAGPFLRPVEGPPTSVFGTERILNGKPRDPHAGWDLDAEVGDAVFAAADGEVVLAKNLHFSGGTVILDHGFGLFTLYAHLSEIDVVVGSRAIRGERLGAAGATGRVTGPHLHWGAKIGDRPFDPAALLDPSLFGERQ